jgi:predicted RNA-binding protein
MEGIIMCESAAYVLKDDKLERVMENVVSVDPLEGKVYLTDLLGEQKIVDGKIKEIRLMEHKIIISEE